MSPGKAIAQAGHAYTGALLDALSRSDPRAEAYAALQPGTKIALAARSEDEIRSLALKLDAQGIPTSLIIDEGHVELPDFDGSPILTALGIGPVDTKTGRRLLGRFPLWSGLEKGGAS